MNIKKIKQVVLVEVILIMMCAGIVSGEDNKCSITCDSDLLSVAIVNVEPEEIFVALSSQCNIEVMVHGSEFPGIKTTVDFKELPIKDGVKKLAKACAIRNYMMDIHTDEKTGAKRIVKLDIFVNGSGMRRLAYTAPDTANDMNPEKENNEIVSRVKGKAHDLYTTGKMNGRTSFSDSGDFKWDGSAMIDFPPFEGELPYDKSAYAWDESAKEFSQKTMSIVPPAVRGIVSDLLITTSDDIARDQGADTISPEITSQALETIGKGFNLPPNVINIMPKNTDDFNDPKMPIESDQLKEEYR